VIKNIIEVSNFTKKFGDFTAVDNISFSVEEGSIFAFLGPNGAGKSTTMNTLCTILDKTDGTLKINGADVTEEKRKVRSYIGIVFQESTLDRKLTAWENINLHCDLYNVPKHEVRERIDFVLELVDLQDWRDAPVESLSGGMKRRVEIARGLVHSPMVLFLDEPTAGLDPQTRANMWDYVRKLQQQQNITIFLTTHNMEEAEICHKIAVIDHGGLVALDTLDNLKTQYTSTTMHLRTTQDDTLAGYLRDHSLRYKIDDGLFTVESNSLATTLEIVSVFHDHITDLEISKGTLNDVFLAITGREVRE
jgi:ABC-2 type transport system ATP-binding protein